VAQFVNYVRRFVPPPLLPLIVMIRVRIARHRRAVWTDALSQMRWVVGDDQPEDAIGRLAVGYLRFMIWRGEVRWHPQRVRRQPVAGAKHLRALAGTNRGFVIGFAHHGHYEGLSASLARVGIPNHLVATSGLFAQEMPIWMQYSKRVLDGEGVTLLDVARGSKGIKEVLARGCPVSMALDVPGRTPVRFLGHSVRIATGAARIAMEMNVPVVLVTAHPSSGNRRSDAVLKASEPFYPEEFDSFESLLNAMLQPLEQAIREWPEAYEYPNRRFDPALMD
jgi:lauroyl/myristoyl acyltransferase